ncbi:MAG: sugar ABC transporter permease [Chloroflexia bacterium]|nr:sugar ABC transporter permease [Chloroflexia bacterium]
MSSTPAFVPAASGAVPRRRDWAEQNAKYVFLMPAVLYLILLGVFPLLFSIYLVFNSWQAGSGITFVGLDNIRRLLVDERFWDATVRTIAYVVLAAGLELLLGLLIALCLQVATRGKAALRLTLALPILLPPIAISFAWKMLFDYNRGPVNYFLEAVGLPPVLWLAGQTSALISLVVVDIWQWTPFVALATLAALESLPTEIYEAALVDGAGLRAVLRDITLPLLAPYLVAIVLLRAIDAFKVFDTVYVLTGGGPGTATELLSFYAYAAGFRTFNMGFTATVAWATAIMMSIVFLLYLRAFRRIEEV